MCTVKIVKCEMIDRLQKKQKKFNARKGHIFIQLETIDDIRNWSKQEPSC